MAVNALSDPASVWQEISGWPTRQRLALATRILQSLEQETASTEVPRERQEALTRLIGIWKTDNPPTDDEVDQIVEEERMKQ